MDSVRQVKLDRAVEQILLNKAIIDNLEMTKDEDKIACQHFDQKRRIEIWTELAEAAMSALKEYAIRIPEEHSEFRAMLKKDLPAIIRNIDPNKSRT